MAARLLVLNGIAILGVILFHGTGFGFTAMFSWAHRYRPVSSPNYDEIGTAAYYAYRLIEQFIVFCIPAFLFVSGYFVSVLAGRSRAALGPKALWARIRHLLIPYLFWSGLVVAALALQGRVYSSQRYLAALATGASGPNYYYVPMLVQLYLLAPLVVVLARRWGTGVLAITGLVQAAIYGLQYVVVLQAQIPGVTALAAALPKWLFVVQLFWFTLGVVAGFRQQAFKQALVRTRWAWLTAAIVLFVAGVVEWELLLGWSGSAWRENRVTLIDGLYSLSMLCTFLGFAELRLPAAEGLAALGARSFGIYLSHGVAMEYTARGLYHAAPWVLAHQAVFQPIVLGAGLAIPLVLMALLKRSPVSAYYSYVFG